MMKELPKNVLVISSRTLTVGFIPDDEQLKRCILSSEIPALAIENICHRNMWMRTTSLNISEVISLITLKRRQPPV